MLPVDEMCMTHIVGEHGEIHKHRHCFIKKYSISGRVNDIVQIEPKSMKKRHDELAKVLNHNSPYKQPSISYLRKEERTAKVNLDESRKELIKRCPKCREKIIKNLRKN